MASVTYLLVVLAVIYAVPICAYPTGAPVDACQHMIPMHGPHTVQTTEAPYSLKVSQTEVTAGEPIEVTLSGITDADTFKGFIALARTGSNDETPVGQFTVGADDDISHTMSCGNGVSVSV